MNLWYLGLLALGLTVCGIAGYLVSIEETGMAIVFMLAFIASLVAGKV